MPHVIAYTYEADAHCPGCALEAAAAGLLARRPPLQLRTDEHGMPYDLVDRRGEPVRAVFDADEHGFTRCRSCGAPL